MEVSSRHALGQWFTPPAVADLALALALPDARGDVRVLDPTCGDGIFLARARAAGVPAHHLSGVELDGEAAAAAASRVPGASIHRQDVFAAELPVFDAVVGNPPYVRQERLTPARKQALRAQLGRDAPEANPADLDRLVGRGDLAAACVVRALRLTRDGGRVALVVSSALLDAGYASALWRVVAGMGRVVALVDAPGERWFEDAAVNAMILVVAREPAATDDRVCVARLGVSTSEAARRVRSLADLGHVGEVRWAPATQPERWPAYVRAPAAWFELEACAGDALVRLGDLAEVRRGVTSGANDVFYMDREQAAALGLEPEILVPLLRSPRDAQTIDMDPVATSHVAVVCPADALDRHPGARAYFHAKQASAGRSTLRARSPWWSLPARPARLFMTKAYGSRFVQRLARAPMVADQRVYAVHPKHGVDVHALAGVLNSTFTCLALESLGRASMGEGALEWTVADAATLPVLDPRRLDAAHTAELVSALAAMAGRPIAAIADEHGRADRARLDRAVAQAAPALAPLLADIWPALVAAVARRTERPRRALR